MDKDIVLFKGIKEGIVILLKKDIEIDLIEKELKSKIFAAKDFFEGSQTKIMFSGRQLSDEEFGRLKKIIISEMNIKEEMITIYIEGGDSKQKKLSSSKKRILKSDNVKEMNTRYYRGTLRSGQSIVFEGSVVIVGDVNPGAQISAGGNIIILGSLKGIAHAGIKDESAFVAALNMDTVQIRIAKIIGRAPDVKDKNDQKVPKMAYINNDSIYVEKIDNKLIEFLG